MGLFNLFSTDQQLSDIDKQIEGVISSVPVKEPGENTSEDSPSELIHQILAPEDRFNKDPKKNTLLGELGGDKKQNGIMTDVGTLLDRLTVQADRASRYKTYEEIYSTVPIIKKMMDVWLANLMQKNPVSGRSLIIKDADQNSDEDSNDSELANKKEAARVFVDEILDYFGFIDKLKYRILPTQTMYGDAFIELINLKNFTMYDENGNIDDMFLGESSTRISKSKKKPKPAADDTRLKNLVEKVNQQSFSTDSVYDDLSEIFLDTAWDSEEFLMGENMAESYVRKDRTVVLKERKESKNLDSVECFFEYVQNNAGDFKPYLKIKNNQPQEKEQPKKRGRPKKSQSKEENTFEKRMMDAGAQLRLDLSNVLMLLHDPKNIIILQTTYGTTLGYVEVAEKDNIQSTNINQQLNTIIGKLITSTSNNGVNSQEEILAKMVRMMLKKIIEKTAEKTGKPGSDPEKLLNTIDPTVFNTIKKLVIETDKDNPKRTVFKKLKARFIPVTKMFHFTTRGNEYYPYGRSFIDPLVLQAKLYILSQLANTIMKLSRAAPIRKWIVDVGATQGQSKYIQQLKREKYLF